MQTACPDCGACLMNSGLGCIQPGIVWWGREPAYQVFPTSDARLCFFASIPVKNVQRRKSAGL
jgi:hypothetical protein